MFRRAWFLPSPAGFRQRGSPAGLEFDTNRATIGDLLSMRGGLPDTFEATEDWERIWTDPMHAWTTDEILATVGPKRGPVGQAWEYRGVNYNLLGLIVEEVAGRPLAGVLRAGVLDGDGYERLIYQPHEKPTDPMALPLAASPESSDGNGGYLPSLAAATAFNAEGAMASDSLSLARWFKNLCAGGIVSPASLDEMTDFDKRPEYGLGIIDRRGSTASTRGRSATRAVSTTGGWAEPWRSVFLSKASSSSSCPTLTTTSIRPPATW